MATAIGSWMPPTLEGVKVVGGVPDEGKSKPRFSKVMVLEPVFATIAAPVVSLIPTPAGFVPVDTSGTFGAGGLAVRSITEAVPLPLLATTARPYRWLMAIPCGAVPTEMGPPSSCPKVGLGCKTPPTVIVGLISIIEILLQPLLETTAIGENGPLAN